MFDLLAKLLCSIATFVFPGFASYKALKANDPSQLTPWLMYWVVVACVLVVESWIGWALCWFPFYQEIRAGFMLWLVLPQTQGATMLYVEYVHPTLTKHEGDIEAFIGRAHDQARAMGIEYIRRLVDMVKESIFGQIKAAEALPAPPPPKEPSNYAQALFNRWRVPPLAPYAPQIATDFYNILSSALHQDGLSAQAITIIPPSIKTSSEKARFIELQKQRLNTVMAALDKEMGAIQSDTETEEMPGTLFKSPSQGNISTHGEDFDHVSMADAAAEEAAKKARGFWLGGWGWNAQQQTKQHEE